jgi:hypothetical protein
MEKKFCHVPDIEDHKCIESAGCRYGQPDGPDDYVNECDCYFGE